jgi:hypothetical protein
MERGIGFRLNPNRCGAYSANRISDTNGIFNFPRALLKLVQVHAGWFNFRYAYAAREIIVRPNDGGVTTRGCEKKKKTKNGKNVLKKKKML